MAAADGPQELHGRKLALVFAGLMLVMLMAALDATIVATALPTIAGDLGGLNHISWVTTAYLLAQTVVTPLYGKLGDQYGRRIVLQVGLVIFLIGSALCGLSHTFIELIAFRAFQGLGGGGLTVSAQAAIGDVVPPRQRGRYQGLFGAVFGFATVVGPLLGGTLTTNLSWRWIFYINLPIGALALVVLAVTFPAAAARVHHQIDFFGAALLALALSALVLMVSLGGTTYPWASAQVIGLGVLTVVALGAFVLAERRAIEPVLPLKLLKNQVFVTAGIVALLIGFAMFGAITFLPLYFQVVKGASPTGSGLDLLPLMAGLLITSIVGGQIVSHTGRYRVFPIAGTGIMTVGLFLLVAPVAVDVDVAGRPLHVRDRLRDRPGHAGPGGRRAERRGLRGSRGGHLGQHPLPQHRQLGGDGDHRHHLRHRAGQPAARRLPPRLGGPAQHLALQLGQPWTSSRPPSTTPFWPPIPAP